MGCRWYTKKMWEGINQQGSDGLRKTQETMKQRSTGWKQGGALHSFCLELEWHWSISMTAARQDEEELNRTRHTETGPGSKRNHPKAIEPETDLYRLRSECCLSLPDRPIVPSDGVAMYASQTEQIGGYQPAGKRTRIVCVWVCVCAFFINPKPSVWEK